MTEKQLFVYEMPPIDYWDGWTPVHQMVERIAHREEVPAEPGFRPDFESGWTMPAVVRFVNEFQRAYSRIPAGPNDMRFGHESFVAPLPQECNCEWMFGFKVDNNGTTYIVSPFPLPWLGSPMGGTPQGGMTLRPWDGWSYTAPINQRLIGR